MCGIVGVVGGNGEATSAVRRMAASIAHRGPDDEGFATDRGVALGIRRLSIIDLAGGHQPISNESGDLTIVYNGEVYNYVELRKCLEQFGHRFQTNSDTEVILHAYEHYGAECVHRLNGMFAFAIWNARERTLFIARDRLGLKPLYYAATRGRFVFASEIKAIIDSGLVEKRLSPEAMWHYLTFRYVPETSCIWEGISKLPPGHHLTIRADDLVPQIQRYWEIPTADETEPLDHDTELARFASLFEDSVRLRLIADVPVGILLSGGLDSSAVAAAVRQVHDAPVKTFSVGFRDGGDADESRYARLVAKHLGTEHHEVHIGQEEFEHWMPEFVRVSDEPLADSASVPLFFVARLAAAHVKVVLSGEGSDELLAGYHFAQTLQDIERVTRQARLGASILRFLPAAAKAAAKRAVQRRPLERLLLEPSDVLRWMAPNMTSVFTTGEKRALWPSAPAFVDSEEIVRRRYDRASNRDPLNAMLYVYAQDWLVEDLLMKADKMTMAASIELRCPFLDYRLVEWLSSRPASSKLRIDEHGVTTKVLLREYAERHLPPEILQRPKIGFATPIFSWIRDPRERMVAESLRSPNAWVRSTFSPAVLDDILNRSRQDSRAAAQVWNLYVLETWARRWL